jgi:hypothetical protein
LKWRWEDTNWAVSFLGLTVSQHTFHCIIIRVKFMRYDCFEYTKKWDHLPISTRFIRMPQNASPEEKSANSTKKLGKWVKRFAPMTA